MLTSDRRQRLRVNLTDAEGKNAVADYDAFVMGTEQEQYELTSLGEYNGTAGRYDCKMAVRVI